MVSVIITTYNRSYYLNKCLNSLAGQSLSYPKYEVIVVDNNCTDDTKIIVEKFIREHPELNVSYFLEEMQGLTHARNRGILESKGEIVAFIDDDAVAHRDYCKSLYEAGISYPDFHAFGGKIKPVFPDGQEPPWLSKYVWGIVAKIDLGDKVMYFNKKFPAGCNMAFRRSVLKNLGGFNTNVKFRSDDREIFTRLKSKNYKVLYVPGISVDHLIPEERATRKGIRRIAILSGIGEKNRLSGKPLHLVLKFLDYLLKISAAIFLSLLFLIKRQPEKALIVKIMIWSLQGLLGNEKKLLS